MWVEPTTVQARSVVAQIQRQGRRDCMLVSSECGGRVTTHSLLLSLHSPLLAALLGELGEHAAIQGITLPLTLPEIRGLVSLLQGEGMGKGVTEQEVQKATDLLDIRLGVNVKADVSVGPKEECFSDDNLDSSRTVIDTKIPKKRGRPSKFKVDNTDINIKEMESTQNSDNDDIYNEHKPFDSDNEHVDTTVSTDNLKQENMSHLCDICDVSFKWKNGLKKHNLVKHNNHVNCDHCQDSFIDRGIY